MLLVLLLQMVAIASLTLKQPSSDGINKNGLLSPSPSSHEVSTVHSTSRTFFRTDQQEQAQPSTPPGFRRPTSLKIGNPDDLSCVVHQGASGAYNLFLTSAKDIAGGDTFVVSNYLRVEDVGNHAEGVSIQHAIQDTTEPDVVAWSVLKVKATDFTDIGDVWPCPFVGTSQLVGSSQSELDPQGATAGVIAALAVTLCFGIGFIGGTTL